MEKTTLALRLARVLAERQRVTILDLIGHVHREGLDRMENGDSDESGGISVFEPAVDQTPADEALELLKALVKKAASEYEAGIIVPRVLIIYEAHEFGPEPAGLGFNAPGWGSALAFGVLMMQVRKFGISVVLISQRTAVVAKIALSQCENLIAFKNFDQTGLDYLEAILGDSARRLVPSLPQGEALVFGPAISSAPVAVKVERYRKTLCGPVICSEGCSRKTHRLRDRIFGTRSCRSARNAAAWVSMSPSQLRICLTRAVWDHCGVGIRSIAPDAGFVILEPDARFTKPDGSDGAAAEIDAIDHIFLSEDLYRATRATVAASVQVATSGVDWVHSSSAGIDHPMFAAMLESGATLSHAPGQHSKPMAEYVLGQMLRHAKAMQAHADAQHDHAWRPSDSEELLGKTIGIVGYGGIGAAIAKLAQAFEMRVVATKRRPVEDPNLDEWLAPDRLPELLAQADYIVVSLPLTDETRGLIDAAQLAQLKPSAFLINVARGGVVVEAALVEALREDRLAGAVLDVTEREPLPSDSPLWDIPKLVITPHDSGDSALGFDRTVDHWLRNLARYVRGEPLEDVATTTGLSHDSARRRELGQD